MKDNIDKRTGQRTTKTAHLFTVKTKCPHTKNKRKSSESRLWLSLVILWLPKAVVGI